MRNFILFFFATLLSVSALAQNWAPVGAKWTYNFRDGAVYPGFVTIYDSPEYLTVPGDTVINGQTASIISGRGSCWAGSTRNYMYENSGKIFLYNTSVNAFRLYFDFNKAVADSFYMVYAPFEGGTDSLNIKVDSTRITLINGNYLRSSFVRSSIGTGSFLFHGWVTERVGPSQSFYPYSGVCDPPAGGLRCYSDPGFGEYNTNLVGDCDSSYTTTIISVGESTESGKLLLYPNPATTQIRLNVTEDTEITIYSIDGRVLMKTSYKPNEIFNIASLPNGCYWVATMKGRHVSFEKLIKIAE
jgi:hypothetical protein